MSASVPPAATPVAPAPSPAAAPIRFGLRFKILVGLTVFNTLATLVFTINQYQVEKQRILHGIEEKLAAAASALPDMLPAGYLDRAVRDQAVSPAEYRALVDRLSRYCAATDIRYLYTYARSGGGFYCTSSNGTPEELKAGTFTPYWDLYKTAPPALFEAWDGDRPVYREVKDQWGRFYTLFLPLRTAAGTRFVAGADVTISFVDGLLQRSLSRSILIGLVSFIVFCGASFLLSTQFSRNISRLALYTHELAAANFATRTDSPLRHQIAAMPARMKDEVGQLAGSFLGMEDRLGAYLRELTETTAAKERYQNELRIAGDIQASMLPHDFTRPADRAAVDLHAAMKPAKEAGGDLYDFFPLDEDHLCFVIGDVSDKGMPAALFMAVTITILRAVATARQVATPHEILRETNELLARQNSIYQFVTMWLGIVHVRTGEVVYSDGGHNRPYHCVPGQRARMLPRGGGIALGVMPGAAYKVHTLQLAPGETLFLYTDGVTEAIAADESFYGEARLEALLSAVPAGAAAAQWVDTAMSDVFTFTQGHAQADDITILAIRHAPGTPVGAGGGATPS